MKVTVVLFLTLLTSRQTYSLNDCIGPKDSKTVAIYLHGVDSEPPSPQELENRKVLTKISESLKIGIAIPRTKNKCPNKKQICWAWTFNEVGIIDSVIEFAERTKNSCFPKSTTAGLIGFSNGGSIVTQIIRDCRKTSFNWFIAIGASGAWSKYEKKDLHNCGSLILMAGKSDKFNYQRIKEFGSGFQERKASTKIIEYAGGHEIVQKDLETVLKSVLPK